MAEQPRPGLISRLRKAIQPDTPTQGVVVTAAEAAEQAMAQQGMSTGRSFSPGTPLNPFSGIGGEPRGWDYRPGYNIISRPLRDSRVSFDTLKGIIDAYDVARMAIGHRIDDVRSLDWSVQPASGSVSDVEDQVDAGTRFFKRPDGRYPFRAWLAQYLEDVLRYDAGTLYRRRDRAGRVIGLEVVSGRTIAPLLDYYGRRPVAPAPAYAQFVQGVPFKQFTDRDLIYVPFRPQPDSPYGFAPLESVLLTANTDIRFQMHFLAWFTEGTVPEGFAMLPEGMSSPEQVEEWQQYWDSLMYGDEAAKQQLKFMPPGMTFEWPKDKGFDATFALFLMRKVCAAFHVTPNDLGFTEDVNRATGDTQVDVQFRIGTLPLVQHVEGILTDFLQEDLGLRNVQFVFDTGQEKDDRLTIAQAWKIYIDSGIASPDEGRRELLGLQTDLDRPTPRFYNNNRLGPIPLLSIEAVSGKVDPETFGPAASAPVLDQPFVPPIGVAPAPGTSDQKRSLAATDAQQIRQRHELTAAQGDGTASGAQPVQLPAVKDMTGGVTAATGITGYDMPGADEDDDESDEVAKAAERAAFKRFVKARRRAGAWRDFQFTSLDAVTAHRLNDTGRSAVRKDAGQVTAAGLAVVAGDTGRVLMLQRALDPTDPASGAWEFPGGHVEDGETPLAAAWREWQEETGTTLPADTGTVGATWTSGIYHGHVLLVPSEDTLPINLDAGRVLNPDDPDGDCAETVAWWDPQHLAGNPAVRQELAGALEQVLPLLSVPVVKAGGAGPKGWRDGAPKAPQHHFDLRITDHYTPELADALAHAVPQDVLRRAVEAASRQVVKAATGPERAAMVAAAGEALNDMANMSDVEQIIRRVITDSYVTGLHAAAEQTGTYVQSVAGQVASNVDWASWQPGDLDAALLADDGGLASLLDQAGITIRSVADTHMTRLGNLIADGLLNGDSVDTVASSLSDVGLWGDRAEMVAHTETARAQSAASQMTYQANGIEQWNWLLSDGACEECEGIAEQNPQDVNSGEYPPAHPRCRCAASPIASSVRGAEPPIEEE